MADSGVSSPAATKVVERRAMPHGQRLPAREAPGVHRRRLIDPQAEGLASVARELVVQSRREQGLPDHVTDPRALAQGAQLVLDARRRRPAPRTVKPP